MKRYIAFVRSTLPIAFLLVFCFINAQQKEIEIPELDQDKNTYILEFSNDPKYENVISAYMKGETERDSLRFRTKGTTFPQRVVVTVITEDKENDIQVNIVKKHWEDFRRGGVTTNGLYQGSFDTVGEFGIIISSDKPNVPFMIAVWTSGEIIPNTTSLFYPIGNRSSSATNVSLVSEDMSMAGEGNGKSNILIYVLIGVLIVIAVLLLFILLKKRNKATLLFVILFFTYGSIYAKAWNSTHTGFTQAGVAANIDWAGVEKMLGQIQKVQSFAEALENWLSPDDKNDLPEMDPAEQPQLPSSCIQSYRGHDNPGSSGGNPGSGNSNQTESDSDGFGQDTSKESTSNETGGDSNSNSSSSDASFTPLNAPGEGFDRSKPPNPNPGSDSSSDEGASYQLPRYNAEGDLIDKGDFPNAPWRISMSGKERTTNPYLGNGDSESKPIYDRYGHLKNPDEFPDAPEKIDVTTGFPPMIPVLQGQEQQGSSSVKQPLYDKYGNLLDAGDYPNAPLKVDPDSIDSANQNNPFTGDVSDQSRNTNEPKDQGAESSGGNLLGNSSGSTLSTSSSASSGSNSSGNNNSGPGYVGGPGSSGENSKGGGSGPGNGNPGPGSKSGRIGPPPPGGGNGPNPNNSEGCKCLKNAYERLEDRRIRFEKLRIITERMERQVGFGLSFGDNVAGIHGVLGVIWQEQRAQVLKSLQSYDRTYAKKYREMVADLYEILLEIDRCEAMLGYDDWYNHSGFIYYTYMKDRYKRVKTI